MLARSGCPWSLMEEAWWLYSARETDHNGCHKSVSVPSDIYTVYTLVSMMTVSGGYVLMSVNS